MGSVSEFFEDVDFEEFLDALYDGGWFEYVLPFMLIYAVVLTILNKVELFKDKKPVRVIIAAVFGLFAIAFEIPGSGNNTLGDLMMALFPGVSAFTVGVLALYIVVAMLGVDLTKFFGEGEDSNKFIMWILGALGLFVVIYNYGVGLEWWGDGDYGWWDWLIGYDGILRDPMLYILVLFGLFFWWVTKDNDESHSSENKHGTTVNVGGEHK